MAIEYGWPLGGGLRYSSAFCRWRGVEERRDAMIARPIEEKEKRDQVRGREGQLSLVRISTKDIVDKEEDGRDEV